MPLSPKQGTGRMGHDIALGLAPEGIFNQFMAHGVFIQPSTTGSSQVTGTGDGTYLYNISVGVVVVGGVPLNIAAAADQACEAAADIMIATFSKVYTIIAWLNSAGTVALKVVPGTAALSASAVEATIAEIEAGLQADAKFIKLGTMTIARTGATTVTEAVDNTVRDLGFAE